jgi:hypothetical protein
MLTFLITDNFYPTLITKFLPLIHFVSSALSVFTFFPPDFQLFRPKYHWRDLSSRNAHLVHQNWLLISFKFTITNTFNHWLFWSHPDTNTHHPIKDLEVHNFLSKYLFSFYLVSVTLQKMSFSSFTHTNYLPCLAPPWGQNLYPVDNEIHNFGRDLPALYHHAFSFSYIHVVSEKIFKKGQLWHFLPRPKGPRGCRKPEIHNLWPPCLKDASY